MLSESQDGYVPGYHTYRVGYPMSCRVGESRGGNKRYVRYVRYMSIYPGRGVRLNSNGGLGNGRVFVVLLGLMLFVKIYVFTRDLWSG